MSNSSHGQIDNEDWDMVIQPKTRLLDLNLKEVWKYLDLMWLFVRRDFVAQYKQTVLGPIWHLVQPLFTTVIFLIIFSRIANIPTDGVPPVLFYMAGITMWNYFSSCLSNTSNTFVANAGIFGKVYFPRLIIPISIVVSNIVKFAIQFLLLIAIMTWYAFHGSPFHLEWRLLLIPLLVLLMAGLGLGSGIIISSLTTKYRDFTVLIGFAVQLAMYATPVIYPLSFLQHKSYQWLVNINPLTPVMEAFKYALFGKGSFTAATLGYSTIFMIVVLIAGAIIFSRVEKTFMDTV